MSGRKGIGQPSFFWFYLTLFFFKMYTFFWLFATNTNSSDLQQSDLADPFQRDHHKSFRCIFISTKYYKQCDIMTFFSVHLVVVFPLKASNLPNVCGWVEGMSQSHKKFALQWFASFLNLCLVLRFPSLLGKRLIITFIVIRRIAKTRIRNLEVAKQSQVKLFVGVSINKRQLQKTNMHLWSSFIL